MKRRILAVMMMGTIALGLCACNQKEDSPSSAPVETDALDDVAQASSTDVENDGLEAGSKEESKEEIKDDPEHMETDTLVTYVPVDSEVEWSVTIQYSPDNAEVLCFCPPAVTISGFYNSGKVSGTADACSAFDMGPGADGTSEELVMEAHLNGNRLTLTVYDPNMDENVKYWAKELEFVRE